MNPEDAYRAHTDWARAAFRPDTNQGAWYQARVEAVCRPIAPAVLRSQGVDPGDQPTARQLAPGRSGVAGMRALGPVASTQVTLTWEPRDVAVPDGLGDQPTDVFAPEPGEPEPGSVQAQIHVIVGGAGDPIF